MNDLASLTCQSAAAASHLRARYREWVAVPAIWNETLDVLLSHRSVRADLPDAPPDGTIKILIAAAQSAASSSNLPAWSVIAVQEPARKAKLAALAGNQKHIMEAPLLLVWLIYHQPVRHNHICHATGNDWRQRHSDH
jgi:nitroreductase